MTVVEQVLAPVVTERERRARVLEAAALEIEVRGWKVGTMCGPDGRVCAVGGIALALGHRVEDLVTGTDGLLSLYSESEEVFGVMEQTWLPAWNDNEARDAQDVTFVLRWRAEEIRDGR